MTTPNAGAGSRRGSGGGGARTPGRGAGAGGSGDGSQRGSPGLSATASCLRWAECPQNLLDDPEGVLLLKQFMEDMNPSHARAFDFYFAVKGLKSGCQQQQQQQLVRLINRKYVSRDDCVPISAAVRAAIQTRVRSGDTDPCLFDPALDEVVHFLTDTVYPAFLKSDLYINYLACIGSGAAWQPCLAGIELATTGLTAAGGASCSPVVHTPRSLPTVHEDRELQQQLTAAAAAAAGSRAGSVSRSRSSPTPATTGAAATAAARPVLDLTIKNLYATRFQRGRASLPEFAGGPQTGAACYSMSQAALPYHTSYAPGSKQDSELQSLSSDALTDDTISLADTASSFEQHQHSRRSHRRAIRRSADINKEDPRSAIIPRPATAEVVTAAAASGRPVGCDATNNPAEFARLLTEKLQAHQRDIGRTERLHEAIGRPERPTGAGLLNSDWAQRLLARNSESHNPEQILDNHLETVFDRAGGAQQASSSRPDTEHVHHYHYHHHYGGADDAGGGGGGIAGACRQSKSTSSLADSGVGTVSSRGRSGRPSSQQHRQQTPSASSGAQISFPLAPPQSLQLQPQSPNPTSLSIPISASLQQQPLPQPPPVSQRQLNLHVAQQAASASIAAGPGISGPRQPFACDPNMPLVDKPLTDNVIVEARRRLEEMSISSAEESNAVAQQPQLTIGYFLFGESVPFRCTWSGREITLGQFKQLIAKKGNFRYFFKKRSDEFVVGGAVHEEITDDSEVLPLWDGKVVGKVEKVE